MIFKNPPRGFSLIEILTVVAIIGILSGIASYFYSEIKIKGRDVKRLSDMSKLRNALLIYQNENGIFPAGSDLVIGTGTSCGGDSCDVISSQGGISEVGAEQGNVIMEQLPRNPFPGGSNYLYTQIDSGNGFNIDFTLEGPVEDLSGPDCTANQDTIICTGSF